MNQLPRQVKSNSSNAIHEKWLRMPNKSTVLELHANHMLAALALSDMTVFFLMLPSSLASFSTFYSSNAFRIFFGTMKIHVAAIANWFSCAAIWIILAVTIERLLIIKFPFRSLRPYKHMHTIILLLALFGFTFILTSYHHFSYKCLNTWVCNMTQIYIKCLPKAQNWSLMDVTNEPTLGLKSYLNTSTVANALLGVIMPVFVVAFLNVSLIRLLRMRTFELQTSHKSRGNFTASGGNIHEKERKLTLTAVAIISCFTITQMPSALLFLYEKLVNDTKTKTFADISSITNCLVLTGKMLNVVLFCLTSASFRKKFLARSTSWLPSIFCWRKSNHSSNRKEMSYSYPTRKTTINSDVSSLQRQRQPQMSIFKIINKGPS